MKIFLSSSVRNVPKCGNISSGGILHRHSSSGLGLWKEELTAENKHKIEEYWRDKIHLTSEDVSVDSKNKFYVLSMFPYPSGSLHMGHVRVYAISDSVARFYRMQGKNVIHPMGWDAFGLPAENAARERQCDPADWTKENIQNMREQLLKLGCTFDSNRELATCDPEYYKWTQELFLKLFENGLLYQKECFVNWDPVDQTVLADEQVDENNRSWRSGAVVEKRLLKQWFVKTTVFAKSLMDGLKDKSLKEWRDIIKLQEHWIGECTGTNIDFHLVSDTPGYPKTLTLWTSHPEFVEYVKFIAITKNNLLSKVELVENSNNSIRKLKATVINPFTNKELPIFVTDRETLQYPQFRDDYIGIPFLSEIDKEFCKTVDIQFEPSPLYSVAELEEKRSNILRIARERNIGGHLVSSRLRDWLISRQRYWGTPIPVIYCEKCGCQPVPREQLPVVLPKLDRTSDKKESSLKHAKDWLATSCPKCHGPATRETDTMDTFVDSSWYFMRYIDPKNQTEMFSKEEASKYLPVDLYIGGKEHAVLHLYYARFVNHFLHQLGLVPAREPFKQLLVQGMVMGQSYSTQGGKYLKPAEIESTESGYIEKATGQPVVTAWEKMSKSKYNGVDPSEMFAEYSTDTIRLLMLGDVAPTSHRNWSKETFPGILNWQRRLWQLVAQFIEARSSLTAEELAAASPDPSLAEEEALMFDNRNYYVHGVTFNITGSQQLSVAVSKMQGLTNSLRKASPQCVARGREFERALAVQIIMLAPLAPHFASELWSGFCSAPHRICDLDEMRWDKDVLQQSWPQVDLQYKLKVRVMLNGKDFITLRVPRQQLEVMAEAEIMQLVVEDPKFKKHIQERKITNVHFKNEVGAGARISIKTKKITDEKVSQEGTA